MGARCPLLRYWRQRSEAITADPAFKNLTPETQKHLHSICPRIELVEDMKGIMSIHGEFHWLMNERRFSFGECINRGQQIRFWAPAVKAMPDDALRVVILYELASALGWARGNGFDYVSIQDTLESWGVDQTPLGTWSAGTACEALLRAHGRWIEGAPILDADPTPPEIEVDDPFLIPSARRRARSGSRSGSRRCHS